MKKNIKKIIATLAVGGTFFGYVLSQKILPSNTIVASNTQTDNSSQSPQVPTVDSIPVSTLPDDEGSVQAPLPSPVSKPTPVPTPVPAPSTTGIFKDGVYTGPVISAYYGNIQVQAVVKNGMLVDVIFLQHPGDRNTSIRINNMAMPQLKSEAIAAQSANVNTVSGASASSQAFVKSLQSALALAKI